MDKIIIHSTAGDASDVLIAGKTLSEVKLFMESIDNGSFDHISLQHHHENSLIYFGEETGLQFPEYERFIEAIEKSPYGKLFCWDC